MALIGYRQFASPAVFIGENSTPDEIAAHHRGAASMMAGLAHDNICKAYRAIGRYPTDPKWGRVNGNPEAKHHIAEARRYLRTMKSYLQEAEQVALKAAA